MGNQPGSPAKPRTAAHAAPPPTEGNADKIIVTLLEAKNLAAADANGLSDPFCEISSTFSKQKFRSQVINKNLNPKWNETYEFYTTSTKGFLFFKLYDKDFIGKDFLGDVAIKTNDLNDGKPQEGWYKLSNEPKSKKGDVGEVLLRVHFPIPAPAKVEEVKQVKKKKKERRKAQIRDFYEIGKVLGRGGFSVVKEGTNKSTGEKVAIKILSKNACGDEDIKTLENEILVHKNLKHPNIVQMIEFFDSKDDVYIVIELVPGGELFDLIAEREYLEEADAAGIVFQVLTGIKYMHSHGIVHRDLKPENLMVTKDAVPIVKITDFGSSKNFESNKLSTFVGTPDYLAPEVVVGKPYDNSVDVWSLGVITYILLCGFSPFGDDQIQNVFMNVMAAKYEFPSPEWDEVSEDAKNFIKRIFVIDPKERATPDHLLQDPWITKNVPAAAEAATTEVEPRQRPTIASRRLASVRRIQQRQEVKKKNQVKKPNEDTK